MKYFLLICDGMAEAPLAALGGKTPFEAACTPNMDALAARGAVGTLCNCPPGLPAGSDTAILSILGADPLRFSTGRAALEAADAGICLTAGEVAVRANLIRLSAEGEPGSRKILSSDGIRGEAALEAVRRLLNDPAFCAAMEAGGCRLYPRPSFAQLAVLPAVQEPLAPPHEHLFEPIEALLPQNACLRALTLRSAQVLAREQLALWFWGAGTAAKLPPFPRRGTLISATPVCRGIGRLMGLELPNVAGATGTAQTDYRAKAAFAVTAWEQGSEFVAVHIEAPDERSHAGDLPGKLASIGRIDALVLPTVLDYLRECGDDYRILILSDHHTSTATGRHGAEPVPYIFFDSRGESPAGDSVLRLLGLQPERK